jgi:hypothetical protein
MERAHGQIPADINLAAQDIADGRVVSTVAMTDNGLLSLLQDGQTIGAILDGDDFANNNTTVADACKNVEKSTASASGIFLNAEGQYTLTITGTVKGVASAADTPFSVSSTICISAGTCQVCP